MLINHLDIASTHLASAVIQVGQELDTDGGWPLEVMNPDGTGALTEVYLQPGEMVLYEGARLKHGRPMRFKGEEFGNIFTHFAPVDWKGPGEGWVDARAPAHTAGNTESKEDDYSGGPSHTEL
jgi:prolyl 4-hydroxylase